ncbi:MAG: AIR synthase-related protein [Phycisphaeraceae bacterium]
MTATAPVVSSLRVHRVEVRPRAEESDPLAEAAAGPAGRELRGFRRVSAARLYLIEGAMNDAAIERVASELLTDPVTQRSHLGVSTMPPGRRVLETHYLPGVMDPVAQSTEAAIAEMLGGSDELAVSVRTGVRYDLEFDGDLPSDAELLAFSHRHLANAVIQAVHVEPLWPEAFPHGTPYEYELTTVAIRDLDDAGLMKLSREGHLFLSLEEMQRIRGFYREAEREPTDVELETFAQTWSEHCVHKTLRSTVRYTGPDAERWKNKPGHELADDGSLTIRNLLKSTIAAATNELRKNPPHDEWLVSVFDDNAGVVRFDHETGIAIKVETHNHPSAIEPYGGAATGIGGCIRDIIGTGLAAKPFANTDVFCVAHPDRWVAAGDAASVARPHDPSAPRPLPQGVLHPRRILERVVAGVRDYGNRMGIPTVNGAVVFHDDYLGNPLVYCGSVGTIPLDKAFGEAKPGDRIIALGGATGRDGIHGATFSSSELTDTHADEFSHAVQIGNPITEKRVLDVILQARDHAEGCLFSGITDCGAGGFSSAIGEMGEKIGAAVELDRAPLKYAGLSYTEVWISEAQERMVLSVPPEKCEALRAMCEAEGVTMADLGQFGCELATRSERAEPTLVLTWHGKEVGRMPMELLHEGIPMPTREAVWAIETPGGESDAPPAPQSPRMESVGFIGDALMKLLGHPNIASKHWIIRQYDHEVQGGSAVKPLVGPQQDGPSDAAVLRPKLGSRRALHLPVASLRSSPKRRAKPARPSTATPTGPRSPPSTRPCGTSSAPAATRPASACSTTSAGPRARIPQSWAASSAPPRRATTGRSPTRPRSSRARTRCPTSSPPTTAGSSRSRRRC